MSNGCKDPCNKCGAPLCENKCECKEPNYSSLGCVNPTFFECVTYNNTSIKSCLGFKSGNTLSTLLDLLELWKCDYTNKITKTVVDNDDLCYGSLFDKLEEGNNIIITKTGTSTCKKIKISSTAGGGTNIDQLVKASSTDTTSSYLVDKLISSDCITYSIVNAGLNEKVKANIDWNCVATRLKDVPAFCTAVNSCVTVPPSCGQVTGIQVLNADSDSITYSWISGTNNTSFNIGMYTDVNLSNQIGNTVSVTSNTYEFNGLTANTLYYLKVQPICQNGSTVTHSVFGPSLTSTISTPTCPTITLNEPIVTNDNVTVSWTSVGTSFKVYLNNVLLTSPVQPQSSNSITLNTLPNGNYNIKVEALPCVGTPNNDSKNFTITHNPPCVAPSKVILSSNNLQNVCPTTTVNLNSSVASYQAGTVLEFHTNSSHTSIITNPIAYGASGTVYVFAKNQSTNCYSIPVVLTVSIITCTPNPIVNILDCGTNTDITPAVQLYSGYDSNFVANIPVSVTGSGTISVTVLSTYLSLTSSYTPFVNGATSFLNIPLSFNGTLHPVANVYPISITFSGTSVGTFTCNYLYSVSCKELYCITTPIIVSTSNITATGYDTNIAGLRTGACVDTYKINIVNTFTNTVVESASNQTSPSYFFNSGLPGVKYSSEVIRKLCCGTICPAVASPLVSLLQNNNFELSTLSTVPIDYYLQINNNNVSSNNLVSSTSPEFGYSSYIPTVNDTVTIVSALNIFSSGTLNGVLGTVSLSGSTITWTNVTTTYINIVLSI